VRIPRQTDPSSVREAKCAEMHAQESVCSEKRKVNVKTRSNRAQETRNVWNRKRTACDPRNPVQDPARGSKEKEPRGRRREPREIQQRTAEVARVRQPRRGNAQERARNCEAQRSRQRTREATGIQQNARGQRAARQPRDTGKANARTARRQRSSRTGRGRSKQARQTKPVISTAADPGTSVQHAQA